MARVRQKNTQPELAVRAALRRLGACYRTGGGGLPGRPDIHNKRRGWVIFVNGCYWHHHRGCNKATVPARNREFWLNKFVANRRRDAKVARELRNAGFRVLIVWQCQTSAIDALDDRLRRFVLLAARSRSLPPRVATTSASKE